MSPNTQTGNGSLVSIIVATYNSSAYVLETLESVKSQTYQNIELIVTDDCSTDETVVVCRKWIDENCVRFIRVELIIADKNGGIPANCNRGLQAAKGDWIKFIAGDDMLMPRCIETFISEVKLNPDDYFFSCGVYQLEGEFISEEIYAEPSFLEKSGDKQFKYLAVFFNYISGPSTFMNKSALDKLGGFEERYRVCEDFPLFVKITSAGYRFRSVFRPLVIYRINDQSISHKPGSNLLSDSIRLYLDEILLPLLKGKGMFFLHRHHLLYNKLIGASSKIDRQIMSFWMRLTDPYVWILKYHKLFYQRSLWNGVKTIRIVPTRKSKLMKNSFQ